MLCICYWRFFVDGCLVGEPALFGCSSFPCWGCRFLSCYGARSLFFYLAAAYFVHLVSVLCFVLGWAPCLRYGSSSNHCQLILFSLITFLYWLWCMSSKSLSLFVNHVYDLVGSPAMYIFWSNIYTYFWLKKRIEDWYHYYNRGKRWPNIYII